MPVVKNYTVADLAEFPDDGKRYELIRGELVVSPAPSVRHQIVLFRLAHELATYLKPLGLGDTLFPVAADISWDDQNLVQPDLLVVRPEELSASWTTVKRLRLAVEVVSPSSRRRDRGSKRTLYQEYQVETYWVIDADAETVERWHPDDTEPEVLYGELRWQVRADAPEVLIDLARLFDNLPT